MHGRSGHLWQNRFFSCALDEGHLWTALCYVEPPRADRTDAASSANSKPPSVADSNATTAITRGEINGDCPSVIQFNLLPLFQAIEDFGLEFFLGCDAEVEPLWFRRGDERFQLMELEVHYRALA